MITMKIYISGKIGDLPMDEVRVKFAAGAACVVSQGHEPVNPLELHDPGSPHPNPSTWKEYMVNDISALLDCQAILMLPDWQDSPGGKVEHGICMALNRPIFYTFAALEAFSG